MLTYQRDKWIAERGRFSWHHANPLILFEACSHGHPGRPATKLERTTEIYNDDQFHDYLNQEGSSADWLPPDHPRERLRLAFCEREGFDPPEFCLSRGAFEDIEAKFQLSPATIPVFTYHGGSHTYRFDQNGGNIGSLGLVVKLPQLFQIGNWGMSLRYCFSTRTTNALILGRGVIDDREWWTGRQVTPVSREFMELVKGSSISSWHEPLLLPVIFLQLYIEHLLRFVSMDIDRHAMALEKDLGVQSARNFVNRSYATEFAAAAAARMVDHMSDGQGRAEITSRLNTTNFNAICVVSNIKWAQRYVQTLKDISDELDKFPQLKSKNKSEVQQTLEFLTSKLLATQDYVDQIKDRLDLQLAMLTNYSAQADNDQNIKIADQNLKIARDTRVDSLAMKALAVVTVVFLPPSLVATIFSMSMFDWQAPGSQVVTHKLWIYWAVSVPLAILLIISWLMWWNWQTTKYDKAYSAVRTSARSVANQDSKND